MATRTLDEASLRVSAARQSGKAEDLVEALNVHANLLVKSGQLAAAVPELDEAATIYQRLANPQAEARYQVLAATVTRLLGRFEDARGRAQRAIELSIGGGLTAVSAWTTLGDVELAAGRPSEAMTAYARALQLVSDSDGDAAEKARLLRQQAIAQVAMGRSSDAAASLVDAHDQLLRAGKTRDAVRALVEAATAAQQAGDTVRAHELERQARPAAEAAGDRQALADLDLLAAAAAVDSHQITAALQDLMAARSRALEADAPISYVAAVVGISELSAARDDRLTAYESLATGWATLGDRLGQEAARAIFEPKLRHLQQRWGPAAFATVKAAYEVQRRAATHGDTEKAR